MHPLQSSWVLWYDSKQSFLAKNTRKQVSDNTTSGNTQPHESTVSNPAAISIVNKFIKNISAESWKQQLNQISTVATVEAFWKLMQLVRCPTALYQGDSYYFFKEGIIPMWEDDANVGGGRWCTVLSSEYSTTHVDTIWEELLMSLIGEYLEYENSSTNEITRASVICGAVLSHRKKGFKLSLWLKNDATDETKLKLKHKLIDTLHLIPELDKLEYILHCV